MFCRLGLLSKELRTSQAQEADGLVDWVFTVKKYPAAPDNEESVYNLK